MNAQLWWPWLLSAVGILGLLLVGKRRAVGWYVGLAAQGLWVMFAIITGQLGFLLSAVVYGATYARNAWLWTRQPSAAPAAQEGGYSAVEVYDQHIAPLFASLHRDINQFHGEIVSAIQKQIPSTAISIVVDHRLAWDPVGCLGCSWQPEKVAPAYSVVDQHSEHLRRELFKAYADREGPIRLCMP